MKNLTWALIFVGCATQGEHASYTVPTLTPTSEAPPPPSLVLEAPWLLRGLPTAVRVSGAAPGTMVGLAASARTSGPRACPALMAPICLDLHGPITVVASGQAGPDGVVVLSVTAPAAANVTSVQLQAVAPSTRAWSAAVTTSLLGPAEDADADGLSNRIERDRRLDPLAADTDGDTLGDGHEVGQGTDPRAADTDGDALGDGVEVGLGTNPLAADTDGGGADDSVEVARGTDPRVTGDDACAGPCAPDCAGVWDGDATRDFCGVCDADPSNDCCTGPGATSDGDGDGVAACDDCDDANPAVYPGALEICDGRDNDCSPTTSYATTVLRRVEVAGQGGLGFSYGHDIQPTITAPPGIVREVEVTVNIEHVRMETVDVTLTHLSSNVPISYYRGAVGQRFQHVVFDDDAAGPTPIQTGPLVGRFRPHAPLAAFDGLPSDGAWGLRLSDSVSESIFSGIDVIPGTLHGWKVTFLIEMPAGEADADGDGFAACADCDDTRIDVRPGGVEACNGADDDCDGILPPSEADVDDDGSSTCGGDCDDQTIIRRPGGPEICNGLDENCDGSVAGELDSDGDGTLACADCNDQAANIHPGAAEYCNWIDDNCDGIIGDFESDHDGDGWAPCTGDCMDENGAVHPGAESFHNQPYTDPDGNSSFDYNCDGQRELAVSNVGVPCSGVGYAFGGVCTEPVVGWYTWVRDCGQTGSFVGTASCFDPFCWYTFTEEWTQACR